jgi:hypothetical protein
VRLFASIAVGLLLCSSGCTEQGSPEAVADSFADAYFRRMDQEKAKEYTALGASQMLDKELRDVYQIRKEGYNPSEARAEVDVRRGEAARRDQRIRFPFRITIRSPGAEPSLREADVELAQIQGAWKVVRVGMRHEGSAGRP